jgi:hypothetical protein
MREIRLWSSPLRARSRTKSEQDVSRLLKTRVKQRRDVGLQRHAYENPLTPCERSNAWRRSEHSFSARIRGNWITDRPWEREGMGIGLLPNDT